MQIKNNVALITGGNKGIGKAITLALAKEGAKTVINYYFHKEEVEELQAFIKTKFHTQSIILQANISSSNQVEEMLKKVIKNFSKIDIIVNNAGIKGKNLEITDIKDNEWNRIIDTNLKGVFNVCKFGLPYMMRQRKGVIVNISSIAGLMGASVNTAYAASKAGIIGLSLALASQVSKYGIRVNVIAPGAIETSWWNDQLEMKEKLLKSSPLKRMGHPEEVANSVVFLIKNDFINSVILPVDAGRYAMKNVYYE